MEDVLKQKHKVIKKKNGYVHKTEVKYPEENVKKMKESWTKGVNEINDWLTNFEDIYEQTVQEGEKKFEQTLEERKKYFEDFEKLSEKDKLKRMEDLFKKEKEAYEKTLEDKEKLLEDNRQKIREEFERVKKDVETKRDNYLNALNLWNNPEVK